MSAWNIKLQYNNLVYLQTNLTLILQLWEVFLFLFLHCATIFAFTEEYSIFISPFYFNVSFDNSIFFLQMHETFVMQLIWRVEKTFIHFRMLCWPIFEHFSDLR